MAARPSPFKKEADAASRYIFAYLPLWELTWISVVLSHKLEICMFYLQCRTRTVFTGFAGMCARFVSRWVAFSLGVAVGWDDFAAWLA